MDAMKHAEAGIKVPDLCRDLSISSALFSAGVPNLAEWMPP
jgi:hypothetical protein